MRKHLVLAASIVFLITSCLPGSATEAPLIPVDLDATAAVLVQLTLQAMPSATLAPTNTPVVMVETATLIPSETPTTQIETGTPTSTGTLTTVTQTATGITNTTSTVTITGTLATNSVITATETLHVRLYGTLPPNVPYGGIELVNKSKAEAYISLQVTVADGSTTILEYPVAKLTSIQAPVGKYKYVLWVGGNKLVGSFALSNSNDLRVTIYKDRVEIKSR